MECYICHNLVKRNDYTRHIGSHLAGNNTGRHLQPDASLAAFSYDTVDYDHHGTVFPVHSTPPRLRARTLLEHDNPLHPMTPSDQLHSDDLDDSLAQLDPADNHREARFTSSRSPAHTSMVHDRVPQWETPGGQFTGLNAFELWLKNPTYDSPGYTTIDGQKNDPDLQADKFVRAAEVLRGTTREEVIKIVKEFEGFSDNHKETCLELVRKVPIFPGLVAYIYTHLVMCPRRGWFSSDNWSDRVSDLKQLVERWKRDGDILCILSCDTIKKRLIKFLHKTRVEPEEHKCNPELLNGKMVLKYDILNLAALAAICITEPRENNILDQRGGQAEKFVELFHDLLEANVGLEGWYRRCFFNALILFSKESGCCPRGIYLAEDALNGLVSESQGGFGDVYKGRISSRLVAVKAIKRKIGVSMLKYNKQLSKEAIVWRHLRHPNCLPLYGIYNMPTEGPNISVALVSPWMDQGTLSKYLERNPEANRTRLILDVVRGLSYLHSMEPHVAHRDIKPDNILITKKGHACLADFGLVSTFDTDDHFQTATDQVVMGGTPNYMAPEIFNAEDKEAKRKVNKRACDMYALGCTIYAAYTGRDPFHGMNAVRVGSNVISDRRPEFPEGKISPDMWSFVENLWGPDPLERLTAQMALGWMEEKAYQERVDATPAPFEEEWEWRGPPDDKCLWSVSI